MNVQLHVVTKFKCSIPIHAISKCLNLLPWKRLNTVLRAADFAGYTIDRLLRKQFFGPCAGLNRRISHDACIWSLPRRAWQLKTSLLMVKISTELVITEACSIEVHILKWPSPKKISPRIWNSFMIQSLRDLDRHMQITQWTIRTNDNVRADTVTNSLSYVNTR